MDAKSRCRTEVTDFLTKYDKFIKELEILNKECSVFAEGSPELEMKTWQFRKVYEQPLDDAWQKLTMKEKSECLKIMHPQEQVTKG